MRYGRIGGGLVIGGWALAVIGIGLSWVASSAVFGLVGTLAAVMIGSGAAVIAIAGVAPLRGLVVRVGLGLLAVGLTCLVGSAIVAARLTYEPFEDAPFIVLFVAGWLASSVGMLVTQLALIRAGGLARRLGVLFFAGLASTWLMGALAAAMGSGPLQIVAAALAVLGATGFVIGCAAPGVLVVRADRAAVAVTS